MNYEYVTEETDDRQKEKPNERTNGKNILETKKYLSDARNKRTDMDLS